MFHQFQVLKKYRNFRLLYLGQGISFIGSQMTMVALPFQIYHLTHSSFWVGVLSFCALLPLLVTALVGGAIADRFDRRKILLIAESILALCLFLLFLNANLQHPLIWPIYFLVMLISAVNGLHRPSIQSMLQILVDSKDKASVGSLWTSMITFGMVVGPSISGLMISFIGLHWTFFVDFCSFIFSFLMILSMSFRDEKERHSEKTLNSIQEGLKFALTRQELLGSYAIDFVAMIFGMPSALFPALAVRFGGAHVLGFLYSSLALGSFIASLTSGWAQKVKRSGAAITISAAFWGVFIIGLGYTHHFIPACICLALAGAADAYSGVFRQTLWVTSVPNEFRGRLAGIEMISYMSGPMLGNLEAGIVASIFTVETSIISGGFVCILGVMCVAWKLPIFWQFKRKE